MQIRSSLEDLIKNIKNELENSAKKFEEEILKEKQINIGLLKKI